jgi:RHS repeat-associated protein
MTPHRLAGILVASLFFLHGGSASAQSCPQTNFTGTVTIGDESQPISNTVFNLGGAHCCGIYIHNSRLGPGDISLGLIAMSDFDIDASAEMYLPETHPASVDCSTDPVTQCVTCNPDQMSFSLYGVLGSFDGTVISLPSRACGVGQVYAGPFYANIDSSNCTYDFARGKEPPREANHWAVYVYRSPTSTGPGYGTYALTYGSTSKDATTWSSHSTTVNFCPVASGTEATDIRSRLKRLFRRLVGRGIAPKATGKCNGSSSCVGLPVDVASGNMYFDQADAEILGLGGLQFARSYNSDHRGISSTLFGAGWFSTYEKRLEIQSSSLLKLRQEDGVVVYFADPQGDLRFDASLPLSRESWIVKQPDGTYVHSFRAGGSELYDAAGRLLSFADESGNVTTLTYVGSELRTITAPSGRALTLAYVGGHPSTLSGPAGLVATYTYDASSRLETVTYADAAASGYRFTYDTATGAIATVADLSGKFVETHAYDGSGRAYTSEVANGQEKYTFTYGANQTTVTDALNNVTTYDYVSVGGERRVTRVVGPCEGCGGMETQQFSYSDWATTETEPDGKVTTSNYDPATGDLLSEVETSGALTRTTTYTYDAAGHVTTVSAPDRGQVVYTPGPSGPTAMQDAIGRVTNLHYTARGQLDWVQNPRLKTTTFGYNSTTGDLTSVTDPLLNATTFGYDVMGRRNRITTPAPFSNSTSYTYDVRGRVTRVDFPDTGFVSYTYDRGGRRATMSEKVTSQLTRVTTYAYDDYGRLHTVTDGNTPSGVTTYDYDTMSRLTTITDARGEPTVFHYDAFGRVDQVTYAGTPAPVETFTYYTTGRLKTRTDRKGVITTYTYDDLGRLTQKSYSDGSPAVTFSYDLADRLASASNAEDALNWDYDLAGQVLSEASTANASLVEYPLYDGSGNRITLKLNGSVMLGYEYDDDDRLKRITRGTANFDFTYDAASRRATLANPNGVTTTYAYDVVSRLTSAATKKGNQNRTTSTYTYDFVGDRLTKGGDFSEAYTYDPLDRLKLVKRGNTTTESYSYDKVGNRLSALNSSPWAYNDWNQLQSLPGATFTYDANGNMATKVDSTGSWTYEWTAENQLARVVKNGSEVARYAYDPIGRRIEKVAGGVTTTWLYDGEDILRQTVGTTATTYIHGPNIDEPLASENAAGVRTYLHADGLGSIVKTTNSSGAAVSTVKYNAFGVLESGVPAPYAFTGREWDPESGLYYYRARYYDPKIGRFLTEDPLGLTDGINRYAYVKNNPVNRKDPSGMIAGGVGGGFGVGLVPPLPLIGFVGDANCHVVADGHGNIGVLCCAEGGPALGGFVGAGPQGAGVLCLTCDTICDLEDWSLQFAAGGGAGPGMMASGGPFMNAGGGGVAGSAGPAAAGGGYVGLQFGGCKLFWQRKPCKGCSS